jgi:hypothetical protein
VHYLYRLTDPATGEFYIGVRSCDCEPDQDGLYQGSGRWPQAKAFHRTALIKQVIATFHDRDLACEAELLLIDLSVSDFRCRNSIKTASPDVKLPRRRKWGYA